MLALALLAACGGRAPADDAALARALAAGESGTEVTFHATVTAEPSRVGDHEHIFVATPQGEELEVDHNLGLASWVPAHRGDELTLHGELYVDAPGRDGVHCTHARTSRGCPEPGWIELHGTYYE